MSFHNSSYHSNYTGSQYENSQLLDRSYGAPAGYSGAGNPYHWKAGFCCGCCSNQGPNAGPKDFLVPWLKFSNFLFLISLISSMEQTLTALYAAQWWPFALELLKFLVLLGIIILGYKAIQSIQSPNPDKKLIRTTGQVFNCLNTVFAIALVLSSLALIFTAFAWNRPGIQGWLDKIKNHATGNNLQWLQNPTVMSKLNKWMPAALSISGLLLLTFTTLYVSQVVSYYQKYENAVRNLRGGYDEGKSLQHI
jgi:hypothetical protein